ncbi:DHH family phosphoesterase [Paramaledivibacter caminithermalis]|jgi:phosphoesterase RecJ-like protein|uniref:Phosphoesterase RecJ domain-containing protein n=1 Tax=Paramaledivibacter caminithermalis (strain DSM 15212 / CIP 107654 / DViRD3) TaxID=1121301 RepID=A0A1M6N588_PARC5|nr:bifunctional oligoribonuclease/PAP phosphatase NrnA [Paramaledivibacter caminithermalis]SHJ90870.1 phosphoesterase RecJ domain-containing protein [Paramaledivibacter caminithermalis DSM 15212]
MISKDIVNILRGRKHVIILPHILPDGDTLGSSLALANALRDIGNDTLIILDDDIPSNLKFLIDNDNNNIMSTKSFLNLDMKPDLIVTIDTSDVDRLGDRYKLLGLCEEILNIDHHITNRNYGKYNYVDAEASSCGEIIYEITKCLDIELSKDISTYLYVALSTDTGSFKYSNTSPKTLRIAANLLEAGIDTNYIITELYQNRPINKIKLLSDALNNLERFYDGRLSLMYISLQVFESNNLSPGDADGIIEYARDIEGVEVAVLLKELSPNEIKVGFRSKYDIDVSAIAEEFNGGGHKKASGCTIFDTIENAKKLIVEKFKNIF